MLEIFLFTIALLAAFAGYFFSVSRVDKYIGKYRLQETKKTLIFGWIHLRHVRNLYLLFLICVTLLSTCYTLLLFF